MDSQLTVLVLGIRKKLISDAKKKDSKEDLPPNIDGNGEKDERTMGLTICNGFSSTISFAIGWPDSSQCANSGKWKKRGWWNVAPGQCARVYGSSLKSLSRMAYYGRTYDRSREWRGITGYLRR